MKTAFRQYRRRIAKICLRLEDHGIDRHDMADRDIRWGSGTIIQHENLQEIGRRNDAYKLAILDDREMMYVAGSEYRFRCARRKVGTDRFRVRRHDSIDGNVSHAPIRFRLVPVILPLQKLSFN